MDRLRVMPLPRAEPKPPGIDRNRDCCDVASRNPMQEADMAQVTIYGKAG